MICAIFLSLMLFALTASPSVATPLNAGQVLQVTFTTDPISFPCPGICDTLWISVGGPGSVTFGPGPSLQTYSLFNGATALGPPAQSSECCIFVFQALGSMPFPGLGSEIVDFTAIRNGSIQGLIDFSFGGD